MNPNCLVCKEVHERNVLTLYEDDKITAYLDPMPASIGHVVVIPNEHYAIIEQVPDFVVGHMFTIANKISVALFDSLNIHGTNMIIQNGIEAGQKHPHVSLHIIPRIEGDKIDFQWKNLSPSQDELATAELQLKEPVKNIGEFEKEKAPPIKIETKKEVYSYDEDEENYLIKHLRRMP